MLGFINLVVIITGLIDFIIRKKYKIKMGRLSTYQSKLHQLGERILLILLLLIFSTFYFLPYKEFMALFFIGIITTLFGARAFLEFRHAEEKKTYWSNTIWAVASLVIFVGVSLYMFNSLTVAEAIERYENFPSEIHKVEIQNREQDLDIIYVNRKAVIEEKQKIDELMNELAQTKLRRGFDNRGDFANHYRLNFDDELYHSIIINDKFVLIGTKLYKVIGENYVYEMFNEANLVWELPK